GGSGLRRKAQRDGQGRRLSELSCRWACRAAHPRGNRHRGSEERRARGRWRRGPARWLLAPGAPGARVAEKQPRRACLGERPRDLGSRRRGRRERAGALARLLCLTAGDLCRDAPRIARRQRAAQTPARVDSELREHLVQMPLDGAGAQIELFSDLRICTPVTREPCDVFLLRGEIIASLIAALADPLARREKLVSRAIGEPLRAHRGECFVRLAELLARVGPALLAPQPLAVAESGPGNVSHHPSLPPRLD